MLLKIQLTAVLFCLGFGIAPAADDIRELTDAEQSALATVTQENVLGCVSFLASDELAGRDTPSRELEIASAFVAAQFAAAGLEGLEEDGSLFQEHDFPTSRPPKSAEIASEEGAVAIAGVLCGSSEVIEGIAVAVSEDDAGDESEVVCIDEFIVPPQAAARPCLLYTSPSPRDS